MKVIVVGAGIMGLSTAWALHRRGHVPIVYEQGSAPNPHSASSDHTRLIRYCYGPMQSYAQMVREAFEAFELLWLDIDRQYFLETGTLVVARGDAAWLDGAQTSLLSMGLPFEALAPSRLARRYPFLAVDDVSAALHTPSGGVLFAEAILHALIGHVRAVGHAVLENTPVRSIDPVGASVVLADGRRIDGDAVIVAAGAWSATLVPEVARRVTPSHQVFVHVEPPAGHLDAWRRAPMILDGIDGGGGGFYAVPPIGGFPLKIGDHTFSLTGHPDQSRYSEAADVALVTDLAHRRLAGFDAYHVVDAATCFYSVTTDQAFIVEQIERAVLLTGFSGHGFKFGPLIGLAVAASLDGAIPFETVRIWAAGRGELAPGIAP